MIEIPQSNTQLVALMRRPDFGGPLRFVEPRTKSWRDSVSIKPEDINKAVERISALIRRFPRGVLQGQQKRRHRVAYYPEMGSVLRAYAGAVGACPEIKVDVQALLLLSRKLARYLSIRQSAGRAVNSAIDLRLMLGALQWFMLRVVLVKVVDRLEAPDCTRAEAEKLQSRFAKLLLNKELLLMTKEQRQQLIDQKKKDLEGQLSDIEKQTLVADMKQAILLGRPYDQATLELAARYNKELKDKQEQQKQQDQQKQQNQNSRKAKR